MCGDDLFPIYTFGPTLGLHFWIKSPTNAPISSTPCPRGGVGWGMTLIGAILQYSAAFLSSNCASSQCHVNKGESTLSLGACDSYYIIIMQNQRLKVLFMIMLYTSLTIAWGSCYRYIIIIIIILCQIRFHTVLSQLHDRDTHIEWDFPTWH